MAALGLNFRVGVIGMVKENFIRKARKCCLVVIFRADRKVV
jgi:hypothetical protein